MKTKTNGIKSEWTVLKISIMAMFSAIAVILVYLIRFPIIPIAPYLEYDPADIPIIIVTFMFGIVPGLAITAVVSILQGITVSAGSGFFGIIMHIIATGTMVTVVGLISKKNTINFRNYIAIIVGAIAMIAVMIPLNLIITPLYTGSSVNDIVKILIPAIIPFNAIKAAVNLFIALHVYIGIHLIFKKSNINIEK